MTEERRKSDPRIDTLVEGHKHLHDCFEDFKKQSAEYRLEMKAEIAKNTEVTEQVRDILASFRVVASIAKWVTAIAGSIAGVWAMVKGFRA